MPTAMDPKQAECVSFYLYGAGWYSKEDNSLIMATGRAGKRPDHFCLTCPKQEECTNEHERRVRRLQPAAAEKFDVRMKQALKRGMGATLAAVHLGRMGLDPYATAAVENFKQGHADRGAKDGALIR